VPTHSPNIHTRISSHAIKKFLRTLYLGGARVISAHFNQNEGSTSGNKWNIDHQQRRRQHSRTEPERPPHLSTCTNYSGGFICSHRCAAARSFVCEYMCIVLCVRERDLRRARISQRDQYAIAQNVSHNSSNEMHQILCAALVMN
jgi:hypothetical protein